MDINKFAPPPTAFIPKEYQNRITMLQKELVKLHLDGAIITRDISRLYLTGFESTAGTLYIDALKGAIFTVDFRYILMAERAMPFVKCLLLEPELRQKITKFWKHIGYESNDSETTCLRLRASSSAEWTPIDQTLTKIRAIKSPLEQDAMRKAINAGDELFAYVRDKICAGLTEWDVRNYFRRGADSLGEGESFDTIVCAGANSAECHHKPGLKTISKKANILIDFGVKLNNYCSDMTRCLSLTTPSIAYQNIYNLVLEANEKVISEVRPGMLGCEVDAIARNFLKKHKHGEHFGHSLGHSVGMEIHESPNFSPNDQTEIKPGMVITVEPGIYIPHRYGVRIEDVILITKSGCEVLTHTPKTLTII